MPSHFPHETAKRRIFSIDVNGNITFDPNGDFDDLLGGQSRVTTFDYTIVDADGLTSTATVTVTVSGVNAPPVLEDPDTTPGTPFVDPLDDTNLTVPAVDNVAVSIDLDNYFTDADGDILTITPDLTGLPSWVTYNAGTGVLSGTPPIDNAGPVVVPVTVTDGNGGTFTGTITLAPVNPGPVAEDDFYTVNESDGAIVVGNAILDNDIDPDGDFLTATVQSGVAGSGGGIFSIDASGNITFDP
jgi:VCBS repeat-containing protein